MLKSELIKRLQEEVDKDGDMHLKYVRYDDVEQYTIHSMYSPDRTLKSGMRAKMNQKETEQFCKENPILTNEERVSKALEALAESGISHC